MNIDWQEIKEKYPLAYKKLGNYIVSFIYKRIGWVEQSDFEKVCYCDLETFFDQNGIVIDVYPSPSFKLPWTFNIYNNNFDKIFIRKSNEILKYQFSSRPEAKETAIQKAFEILNNQCYYI